MPELRAVDSGVWTADTDQRFYGVEVGARMTVIVDESVTIHSPIPLTDSLVAQVNALGNVGHIIAPNRMHHLSVGAWAERFPNASVLGPQRLADKRPDLRFDGFLDDPNARWRIPGLDYAPIDGLPMTDEITCFHAASATLIITDLAFHITHDHPLFTRCVFSVIGGYNTLEPTWMERLSVRDRTQFRASIQRVLAWPFERVIMAHGRIVERDGHHAMRHAFRWLNLDAQREASHTPSAIPARTPTD